MLVEKRAAFDLNTLGGVVRTGILAGVIWGLALMVLAVVTTSSAGRDAAQREPMPELLFPLAGRAANTITDGFQTRRGLRRHEAVDVAAPRGTPVLAAADGTVLLTNHPGAGLTVEQDEASGRYCLVYAHLQSYPLGLRDGSAVVRGQVIGFVGTSGNAPPDVPHLHFAAHRRDGGGCWSGAAVDPVTLFGP